MLAPKGNKYALTCDYTYKDVTVPKDYLTDGISYKFRFIGLFISRFDPRYIEAAIVHDYLTDLGRWELANKYFEEMLPDTAIKPLMVKAVRMYAKFNGFS